MNKLLISFILSLFAAMCSIPSVAIASDCATDPNECTLSKLCEMATSSDSNGNTIANANMNANANANADVHTITNANDNVNANANTNADCFEENHKSQQV